MIKMPGIITNQTNVTLQNIIDIVNITKPEDFFIRANTIIYQGVFFFIMLWLLWLIMFIVANKIKDHQPLPNMMYSGAVISILGFIMRAITTQINGVTYGLLTDHQMWIFPIITVILAGIIWATKNN